VHHQIQLGYPAFVRHANLPVSLFTSQLQVGQSPVTPMIVQMSRAFLAGLHYTLHVRSPRVEGRVGRTGAAGPVNVRMLIGLAIPVAFRFLKSELW